MSCYVDVGDNGIALGPGPQQVTVNPGVREQVAFALGQIGDPRAIDGLTAALKDPNPDVREHAAFALGQIR